MFERNRVESQELGGMAVEIVLDDGAAVSGRLMIPGSRTIADVLNGPAVFLDFEPYEGDRRFVAKAALKAIKPLASGKLVNLVQKVRDLDGFDPHMVLGVKPGTAWDDVRSAYVTLAKTYHPDRFAAADLPPEVADYLSGMLRRVNAAYAALELTHQAQKIAASRHQQAVYSSRPRA